MIIRIYQNGQLVKKYEKVSNYKYLSQGHLSFENERDGQIFKKNLFVFGCFVEIKEEKDEE